MRILSGSLKNRAILTPKEAVTRPTSSKMRAQLFNICQHKIEEAHFLDLFAGSGAMGFEALSRGAHSAHFIDHDFDAIETIKKNRTAFKLDKQAHSICIDIFNGIEQLTRAIESKRIPEFELIFVDPPYFQKGKSDPFFAEKLLQIFDRREKQLLAENGWLFIEESLLNKIETIPLQNLTLISQRKTGSSALYEFHYK